MNPARLKKGLNQGLREGRLLRSSWQTNPPGSFRKNSHLPRIAVTGLGIVSSLGINSKTYWNNLMQGRSGISEVPRLKQAGLGVTFAGEIKDFTWDPPPKLGILSKRLDRFCRFALSSAQEALAQSSLLSRISDKTQIGCCQGSGMGGISIVEREYKSFLDHGHRRVSPFTVPLSNIGFASSLISIAYEFGGPCHSTVAACASSAQALCEAMKSIQCGDALAVVAGGTESCITPFSVSGFANLRALSKRCENPTEASRPFDANRDGFVIAEGAATLILENWDHAIATGAPILAEMTGYGISQDFYHWTAPDPEARGATRAILGALHKSGIYPEEVGYINAHGTSTVLNDPQETRALRQAFGRRANSLCVSSTKSMTGHLLGASGALEAATVVLALKNQTMPPTINLDNPDPECDLDYVPHKARQGSFEYALSNSFGFGGHNVCLAFKRSSQ